MYITKEKNFLNLDQIRFLLCSTNGTLVLQNKTKFCKISTCKLKLFTQIFQ